MSKKKPEYLLTNVMQLVNLCDEKGFMYEKLSKYHYRVLGATHVIDIFPSRMVYHRIEGENINAREDYHRTLNPQFDAEQVSQLLSTGKFK